MTAIDRRLDNDRLILAAIKEWFKDHNYSPAQRDLQGMTGISLGNVNAACARLADCGKITMAERTARSIQLVKGKK